MMYSRLDIGTSYSTDVRNSIKNDFYLPTLECTKLYKRAVGYFRCDFFDGMYKSIRKLVANNGNMQLIVSPELTEIELDSMRKGYDARSKVLERISDQLSEYLLNSDSVENYIVLERLISCGVLDIKIAFMENYGLYHEKIGIMTSLEGEKIAFTGSLNETYAALHKNYESIDVYRSWCEHELQRIHDKEKVFDELWNNKLDLVTVVDFPKALISAAIDNYYLKQDKVRESSAHYDKSLMGPRYPTEEFNLRDYQKDAIKNWSDNEYRGLVAMATGTGKTITAISGIVSLWNRFFRKLFVIIVCPYKHLVEQWCEDLIRFNINPIVAYGDYKWRQELKNEIRYYNSDFKMFSCVITTNATYTGDKFYNIISKVSSNRLLIVDEAHNFGASKIREKYNECIEYRLALSATPQRYFDDEGSTTLLKYFEGIVYELNLKEAIKKGFLTEYYYEPVPVLLTDDEFVEYQEITKKIAKLQFVKADEASENLSNLYIKRSRILNLASNKPIVFKQKFYEKKSKYNNLVYCAAGKMSNDVRQIDCISNIIGNELDIDLQKFTSDEDMKERKNIIDNFKQHRTQCIVAIKCLDEGVNIPAIETAFILASSGNEKEFIQRRGRVLRKAKGKKFAYIYDFIVLPRELDEIQYIDKKILSVDMKIVNKELDRIREFVNSSINSGVGEQFISRIERAYSLI